MAAKKKVEGVVVTSEDPAVVIFPNFIEPKPINGKGEPKYTGSFLLDRDEAGRQLAAINEAKAQLWGSAENAPANCRIPLKSGAQAKKEAEAKERNGDFYEGKFVLRTKSKFPPGLVNQFGEELDPADGSLRKLIYDGAIVFFEVKYEAYDASEAPDGIPGVRCYCNLVLFRPGGERLMGGRDPKDAFKHILSQKSMADAESGGARRARGGLDDLDDEIPF